MKGGFKKYAIIILLLYLTEGKCQWASNWFFGNGAGLNFSATIPVVLTSGNVSNSDNTSTISDSNGNLLFYTNGQNVWNKNHLIMPNGNGLIGHNTAGQCAVIIPVPCDTNRYIIFHTTDFANPGYLHYTVVDISLNSGLGDVLTSQKNVSLGSGWTEKICAYYNTAGNNYWVLTHKWNSNEFVAFNVNSSSIATTSVVSSIGSVHSCGSYGGVNDAMGQLTISPDGSKVVNALTCQDKYEIFNFNLSSGVLSNSISISGNGNSAWGTAFSANSAKLYVNGIFGQILFQYDISNYSQTAILNSQYNVVSGLSSGYVFGYMELAPNGKIYVARPNTSVLAVINNPNANNASSNFSLNGQNLGNRTSSWGLSRIAYNIPQNGSILTNTIILVVNSSSNRPLCPGQQLTLTTTSSTTYTWSTGSNQPSIVVSPSVSTIYSVFTQPDQCSSGIGTVMVNVLPELQLSSSSYSICEGKSITINSNGTNISVLNVFGQTVSPIVSPTATSQYTVTMSNVGNGFNCSKTVTTQVMVHPNPFVDFSYSLNPCGGGAFFTDLSDNDIASWFWQFSGLSQSRKQNPYYFFASGGNQTVSLLATNNFGCNSVSEKTLFVKIPPTVSISSSVQICNGNSALLNANGGNQYKWSPNNFMNNDTIFNPKVYPNISTEYSVIISTINSGTNEECKLLLTTFVEVNKLSSTMVSIDANPQAVMVGEPTTLSYLGDQGAKVEWLPLTTPSNSYIVEAHPEKSTTYTVNASLGACFQTFTVHVNVYTSGCSEKDFFVPNSFTPNGDGLNDILYVRGNKVLDMTFMIYNRWGELIFESNNQNIGWDGRFKGKLLESDVFGWYLKTNCINGGTIQKKGNLNLIR